MDWYCILMGLMGPGSVYINGISYKSMVLIAFEKGMV